MCRRDRGKSLPLYSAAAFSASIVDNMGTDAVTNNEGVCPRRGISEFPGRREKGQEGETRRCQLEGWRAVPDTFDSLLCCWQHFYLWGKCFFPNLTHPYMTIEVESIMLINVFTVPWPECWYEYVFSSQLLVTLVSCELPLIIGHGRFLWWLCQWYLRIHQTCQFRGRVSLSYSCYTFKRFWNICAAALLCLVSRWTQQHVCTVNAVPFGVTADTLWQTTTPVWLIANCGLTRFLFLIGLVTIIP